MDRKGFLFTPGDGRPTANAYWMEEHQQIIPRIEATLGGLGIEPVWLHAKDVAISSLFMAREAGKELLRKMSPGDLLIPLTTGWNFPEHFGVVATMAQEKIRQGNLIVVPVCNMEEKAPGYVANRANALILEIMELPYTSFVILEQTEDAWVELGTNIRAVLEGTYKAEIPTAEVAVTEEHYKIAREALMLIRESGGIVPLFNVASMTMAQGWPIYHLWKRMGLTPWFIGSNQFTQEINTIPQPDVEKAYGWLKERNIQFVYEEGGLTKEEVMRALRMYLVKLRYWKQGAIAMGTQGQMDTIINDVATDMSETLMTSEESPEKEEPVDDETEADCEAIFTAVLMKYINFVKFGRRMANGFHDMRHYNLRLDTGVVLNSGSLALNFMCKNMRDLSNIHVVSQNRKVYFLKGGACIEGNMEPFENASIFRAHGRGPGYRMLASSMDILPLTWETRRRDYGKLDPWPMGIVRIPNGKTKLVFLNWLPNHGQHCNSAIIPEMKAACEILKLDFHCFALAA